MFIKGDVDLTSAPPKRVDSVLLRQPLSSREDGFSFLFGVGQNPHRGGAKWQGVTGKPRQLH